MEARGIDTDAGMVATCREAGLDVEQADALAYLGRQLPDGTLGGIFCAQVIEHLPPEALVALVRLAHARSSGRAASSSARRRIRRASPSSRAPSTSI